jgi:predicted site-specific integrase-resolvase
MTEGQEAPVAPVPPQVAIDARVASAENQRNLDRQAERLSAYCAARGDPMAKVGTAVGSGRTDRRPQWLVLREEQAIGLSVVEHQDRLTRFGFRSLDPVLNTHGWASAVANQAEHGTEEWLADRTAIVSSCCARRSSQRRAKRTTDRIVAE